MEDIEGKRTAITAFHFPPSLWLRYADVTFCVPNKQHIIELHHYLNLVRPHIQFVVKKIKILQYHFSTSWLPVKYVNRLTPLAPQFLPASTKNLLIATDIYITCQITPNVKKLTDANTLSIELTISFPTKTIYIVKYSPHAISYLTNFQLCLLISLLTKFKPMQHNIIILPPYLSFQAYQERLTSFKRGKSQSSPAIYSHH